MVNHVFLLNSFLILLCVRVLYSVCVCGSGEGGQGCVVMCVQSQTRRHKYVCDTTSGTSAGVQGNAGSLAMVKTK